MTTKHIHHDVIIAWAEGKAIQFFEYGRWIDVLQNMNPPFTNSVPYRIKPEPKKSVGYKRYYYKNPYNGKYFVHTTNESYVGSGCGSDPEFLNSVGVVWIDTEWQYEIIQED